MRNSMICALAGLVALRSPVVNGIPSSSSLSRNNDLSLDDLSDPPHADPDNTISDPELPPPSNFHGPRFFARQSPPSKPWLAQRAIISLAANANSTSEADGALLGVAAKGGGFATGKSKTTADRLGYSYQGCWHEPTVGKALIGKRAPQELEATMTIEVCQIYCGGPGWSYFGLEFGSQCYCGQALVGGYLDPDQAACNSGCAGNNTEKCGSGDRLSLYHDPSINGVVDPPVFDNSNQVACYVDQLNPRVLDSEVSTIDDTGMTLQVCSDYCKSHLGMGNQPSNYWGVESGGDKGNQCFCSAAITADSVQAPLAECGVQCSGNTTQVCGGDNRILVYHRIS